MRRSTEEILTTHTGSLPRPPALTEALRARDHGEDAPADLEDQIRAAVDEIVARQAQAGVSVVNDGEAGKIGYSTYVKERLDGFGGSGGMGGVPSDLTDYPEFLKRVMSAGIDFAMPTCIGPVSYRDLGRRPHRHRKSEGRGRRRRRQGGVHDRRLARRDLVLLGQPALPGPRGVHRRARATR